MAKKIAVLGAGMSSLSAAYWLTSKPGWQDEYEITVYQLGWRLGGKAASGRNQQVADRTEEHGFHMLFGFYENAFRTMRGCYDALGRDPAAPLSRFCADDPEDEHRYPNRYAVKRNSELTIGEYFNGEAKTITMRFPSNGLVPGDGPLEDLWSAFQTTLRSMRYLARDAEAALGDRRQTDSHGHTSWLSGLAHLAEVELATIAGLGMNALTSTYGPLAAAEALMDRLPARVAGHLGSGVQTLYDAIAWLIAKYLTNLWSHVKDTVRTDWETYQRWIFLDFIGTNAIGFLRDNLIANGFASINDQNYYAWLLKHAPVADGAQVTGQSCLVQFAYDAAFAYANGDATAPRTAGKPPKGLADLEAGTMLHGGMRLFLTYKGALDWLFQAGCGDALVAPMYQLLQQRGVKFEFFHRVQGLGLDPSGSAIQRIAVERQVTLRDGQYQPLVDVDGVPSWPAEPLYDQIVEGEELRRREVNLESYWTDWKGTARTLERGIDFDVVLLGISVAALPAITTELAAASPRWATMLANVKTTRTFGFQVWASETTKQLGWKNGRIRADTGAEPTAMAAEATQVLKIERWPQPGGPASLTYFGGVMPDDPAQPPAPDPAYPPTQQAIARETAIAYLENNAAMFWPDADRADRFDWGTLVDLRPGDAKGAARFDSQFWKANIDPSERYVQSVVGSTVHRLKTDESGFANLYLTGDWIKNGIDSGCMEATVMSGMQAARAICGMPQEIVGEGDLNTLDRGTSW